jgi:hypothetical protein
MGTFILCLINLLGVICSCGYINNSIAKEYKLHVWMGILLLIVNLGLLGINIIRFINSI